jgi:hypothetical protein
MLRVCFFPLPQGGRRDEWAGADRTNDRVQRAGASEKALPKRLIRPLRCNPLLFSIISQA